MKHYVITGAAGNISAPIVKELLKKGHKVTVVGRTAANLEPLTQLGATAAIGSLEDLVFLTKTFTGADAVYTMVPPKWDPTDWKKHIGQIGANFAAAIKTAGVKYVVNLSSVGAHLPEGCGPVSGLYRVEQALNELKDVNVLHLRPSYFYQNLFANLGLIKQAGIMGSNFSTDEGRFPIVDPSDIAAVATEALLALDFKGHTYRYIASEETGTDAIAKAIGANIGKNDLPWVTFTDEQALGGMIQAGLHPEVAKNYTEMGAALNSGIMLEDYWKNKPATLGKVKLNDFAAQFAHAYKAQ